MEENKANILARIKRALEVTTAEPPVPRGTIQAVYASRPENLVDSFRRAFEAIQGQFIYCTDKDDLLRHLAVLLRQRGTKTTVASWSRLLSDSFTLEELHPIIQMAPTDRNEAEVGITDCECLVARTGTILMSSGQPSGRAFPVYVPTHIVVATTSQLVYDLGDALLGRKEQLDGEGPSAWYLVSGPSRTGDIEKTLVLGVHGPVEVIVFLLEDIH